MSGIRWSLLLGLLVMVVGCGDDDATPDAGANTAVDQCLSAGDRALLQGTLPDAGTGDAGALDAGALDAGVGDPLLVGGDCARDVCLEYLVMADPTPGRLCMESCFAMSEFGGLSDGCQTCYLDAIFCSGYNCPIECLGTDQDACNACLAIHCNDRLYACSGL